MAHPKFIITSGHELRLGMVDMHKDLLKPGEICLGGGFYEFDFISNRLLLSGRSFDFGRPKWQLIDRLRVPAIYAGLTIIYRSGKPDDDFIVASEIEIDYIN